MSNIAKSIIPMALMAMNAFPGSSKGEATIPSYKIEQPKVYTQLSKCQLQRMKGKKARKNRGKNR